MPFAHLGHAAPPQSTSVSVPFLSASTQVGTAAQTPPAQLPLTQSPLATQVFPLAHAGQDAPPQSTAVSVPSLKPSEQVGTDGTQMALTQLMLEQSLLRTQALPLTHFAQMHRSEALLWVCTAQSGSLHTSQASETHIGHDLLWSAAQV